jgi:hypothetical protein
MTGTLSVIIAFLVSTSVFAETRNPLVGKWRWDSKDSVTVDFGESHGLGGFKSQNQIIFKILDQDHVVMDRKKNALNDLYRCK